jgi:hypothetical protein
MAQQRPHSAIVPRMTWLLPGIALTSVLLSVGCADQATMENTVAKQKAQDEKIQELTKRVTALEQKPVVHHYELRNEGSRVFRFDPDSGQSCISLASPADWKNPETTRQGCPYQDFMGKPMGAGETYMTRHPVAECLFLSKCNPPK